MVSFELGEELRKMFFVLSRAWDKEKILSPHEESNLRPSDLRSDAPPIFLNFFLNLCLRNALHSRL